MKSVMSESRFSGENGRLLSPTNVNRQEASKRRRMLLCLRYQETSVRSPTKTPLSSPILALKSPSIVFLFGV